MRITESKLRRVIRSILLESMVKNSRGNIDLSKRGKEINATEMRSLKHHFGDYLKEAESAHVDLLFKLLGGKQGSTNEVVINPLSKKDIDWAKENEHLALIPLFVIESKDLKKEKNVIVFQEVGGKRRCYMKMLSGENFVDSGSSEYHGVDSRKKYSNKEQEVFSGVKGKVDYSGYDNREKRVKDKYSSRSPDGYDY